MTLFNSYTQVLDYMDRLGLFSMDMGLGRMDAFWAGDKMPRIPIVHIVGTNGKGSTSTFFESIARAHGLKTGLFTSPHFITPRERIRINGHMLERDVWVELATQVLETPGGDKLTYFEFQTCLAMCAFVREGVDVAVMEAGLGGKYDATNIFCPGVTLFTPIGMDHEKVLGSTLSEIAMDKAGAMHNGSVAVSGRQEQEALNALHDRSVEVEACLVSAEDLVPEVGWELGLRGKYQRENARLAVAGWKTFAEARKIEVRETALADGLTHAFIPGRFQRARLDGGEQVILDGAHNEHAFKALAATLEDEGIKPGAIVFACMADKDISAMTPILLKMTEGAVFCPGMSWERAARAEDTASALGRRAQACADMKTAVELAQKSSGPVLVCGSLYLLAAFYELYPYLLEKTHL